MNRLKRRVRSSFASNSHSLRPEAASSASRRSIGVGKYSVPSIISGVASKADRVGVPLRPSAKSAESNSHATSKRSTLSRVIWSSEE